MDLIGIEPMTSSMPWKRAPSCATGPLAEGYNSSIVSAGAGFVNHRPIGEWRGVAMGLEHGWKGDSKGLKRSETGASETRRDASEQPAGGAAAAPEPGAKNKTLVTGNTSGGFRCLR